jgi:hypothetical protein
MNQLRLPPERRLMRRPPPIGIAELTRQQLRQATQMLAAQVMRQLEVVC